MGWERGRYYTRSRRENGRVVREYFGIKSGVLMSQLDAIRRDERADEAEQRRAVRKDLDERTEALDALANCCDLLTRAALIVAGYRQHNRGEWRKQRVRAKETERTPADNV